MGGDDDTSLIIYCVVGAVLALIAIFVTVSMCRKERQEYFLLDNLIDNTPDRPPLRRVTSAPPKTLLHERKSSAPT